MILPNDNQAKSGNLIPKARNLPNPKGTADSKIVIIPGRLNKLEGGCMWIQHDTTKKERNLGSPKKYIIYTSSASPF